MCTIMGQGTGGGSHVEMDGGSTIASCDVRLRGPIGRVDDVRHMVASPIHRLEAIPDVDCADLLIAVDSGRHPGQSALSNRWQVRHMACVVRREELCRHVLVPAIPAWVEVRRSPQRRWTIAAHATVDNEHARRADKRLRLNSAVVVVVVVVVVAVVVIVVVASMI